MRQPEMGCLDQTAPRFRPGPHPPLRSRAEELGRQPLDLVWLDFLAYRTKMNHLRVSPVRRNPAQIDRSRPGRQLLRSPTTEIGIDEHRGRFGVLNDDIDLIGKLIERRDVVPPDRTAIDPAGQDRRSPTEPRSGDRGIERGTAKDDRTVFLDISADMPDDQIFRCPRCLDTRKRSRR